MKHRFYSLFWIVLFASLESWADNAPITTAGTVLNAPNGPSLTTVPVKVEGFSDIGSFSLKLKYVTSTLTYQSAITNPAFPGMTVTLVSAGTLLITWTGTAGITLPDQTSIVSLNFTFAAVLGQNKSTLKWDTTACEYTQYAGGSFLGLNDMPASIYYVNGVVTNQPAPVTTAAVITNATTGLVAVPLKVYGFTNIGSINLKLEFDPDVLTFQSSVQNPSIPGTILVGNNPSPNGNRTIDISWYGSAPTLSNGSTLLTLNFNFSSGSGTGNYSELTWIDNGPSCQYSNMQYSVLYDSPGSQFYTNGLVASQLAPQTWLPVFTHATSSQSLPVPVNVNGFTNVKSFILSFEYDPAVVTYESFTPNAVFGAGLTVTNNPPGTNGKRKLVLSWTGSSSQSLPTGSSLADLIFTYNSGLTSLTWLTDNASSRFYDGQGNPYYDYPKSTYYRDGLAASQVAPTTIGWYATPTVGESVTVPVKVYFFNGIGSFNLTMDYDPGVLTYQNAALTAPLGGTFAASLTGLGRITMNWSGTPGSLPDSSELVTVTFTYLGGNSPLAWFDNGTSCMYAEGLLSPALFDQPKASFYINGYVGSNPLVADFSASPLAAQAGQTITFTDLTAGGPLTWNWSFDPMAVSFADGTTSASQHPHVKFSANGTYTVSLLVTKGNNSNLRIRTSYIQIGDPGTWMGGISTDWSTATNWFNSILPTDTLTATIPSHAKYWPVFTGDLTLGTHCKNLNLSSGAQLSVTGALTIMPGYFLSPGGLSTIKVGGDWSNSGMFNPVNGTVEFTGAGLSHITGGLNPLGYVKNYSRTAFSAGMTALAGSTAVNGGDNVNTDIDLGFPFEYLGVQYTQARINTNGWISLNKSGEESTSADNSQLFSTANPNTTLAPWWDDLLADGTATVSYKTEGIAPSRVLTVEWKSVLSYSSEATARLNFQVKLYETSGVIEFCYGTVEGGTHSSSESASAGIEDAIGGTGHFIEATSGSYTAGKTTLLSNTNWPLENYRFTPPPPVPTFYHLVNSKSSNLLIIQPDVEVKGNLVIN